MKWFYTYHVMHDINCIYNIEGFYFFSEMDASTEHHCGVCQIFGGQNYVTFHYVFNIYLKISSRIHFENSQNKILLNVA